MRSLNYRKKNHLKKWMTPWFSLFILSCAIIFAFMNCRNEESTGQNRNGRNRSHNMLAGMGSQNAAGIPVQVAEAKKGDISTFLMQTTTIEAERQVDVLAKVAGQVVKLPAEEGDKVKKGDLLAQLDEAELKINFIQAKVRMDTDKATLERAKNMLAKKLVAEENYESTRLQYESTKASYEAARLQLEYTSVRAPFDGVVTARNVELGQRVNVNQPLFTIADFSPLRAKIYVPEKDMHRIIVGQRAKITIESEADLDFPGVVRMISPVVDPTSGTAKVTIDIENDRGKLKPGMFASVYITTETHHNALLIPKKALILESDLDQVYIYQNGSAHKVTLQVGFTSGDDIEVLSGLQDGDLVVTAGQEGLREGLPIRIPGQDTTEAPALAANSATPGAPAENLHGQNPETTSRPRQGEGRSQNWGNRTMDPERLKRMEERLLQNPEIKKEYEKRLKEDPDLKNNPEKKMAFFREMFQKMRGQQGRR
ncbi:MAG: efflux RND transporter periplasmic adaptor subunit [bacterium]